MFPSNLHKNIIQLDKQIALLENECKNLQTEKRKKSDLVSPKCSRASHHGVSPLKGAVKKTGSENLKNTKKVAPPFSARVQSVSSLQSNYSKPWSEGIEVLGERKTKQKGVNTSPHVFPIQVSDCGDHQGKFRTEKDNKRESSDLKKTYKPDGHCGDGNKEHVLHKEVVFSNPGGEIEVTVTKKYSNGKPKYENSDNTKGAKWSEILCLEPVKKNIVGYLGAYHKASLYDTAHSHYISLFPDEIEANSCRIIECLNNKTSTTNQKTPERNFEIPEKLVSSTKVKRSMPSIHKPEKEVQCQLDSTEYKKVATPPDERIPIKVIRTLISELEQNPSKDKKKLLSEMKVLLDELTKGEDVILIHSDVNKMGSQLKSPSRGSDVYETREHCENLKKEIQLLAEDLALRNKTIAEMKKREEEYLSLINSLKLNLEKTKENAQDGVKALQELNIIKGKFLDQMKLTEALRMSYSKLQETLQRYTLENDKLKTQVKIFKLESQKHDVLLAGKETEIKTYKEELEHFRRRISEHLAALKSNAQTVDLEKVMEAIIQQSHIFAQNYSDSFMTEKDQRDSTKQCNGLIHSSPTSRRNSDVNSSWQQISSIAGHDPSVANSNLFADLNNTTKEFFQVYGEDDSCFKHLNGTVLEKPLNNGKKRSSSFTSCMSVHDDDDCGYSPTSKNDVPGKENQISNSTPNKRLSSKKVQSSIDEVLKTMKLQWSKEVQGTSPGNCTIEDFLNSSQVSPISAVSENTLVSETPKKTKK